MKLTKGSASSWKVYETCPARWKAEYENGRVQGLSSAAADKGTAFHYGAEVLVAADKQAAPDEERTAIMLDAARKKYDELFTDAREWPDVEAMVTTWLENHGPDYWRGREVLSTEFRDKFMFGTLPFNYVCDRVDLVAGGAPGAKVIEVVDYKTFRQMSKADDMRFDTQVRAYAVAAMIKYGKTHNLEGVRVTLDVVRHGEVSVDFTIEECREAWRYLRDVAHRIMEDVEPKDSKEPWPVERVNMDCGYCIRKHECKALKKHIAAGGLHGAIDDHEKAVRELHEVRALIKAWGVREDELVEWVMNFCQHSDITGFITEPNDEGIALSMVIKPYRRGTAPKPQITEKKSKKFKEKK